MAGRTLNMFSLRSRHTGQAAKPPERHGRGHQQPRRAHALALLLHLHLGALPYACASTVVQLMACRM